MDTRPCDVFPLRENCNPNNPYEAFLWMLVGLPGNADGSGAAPGGPMVYPPSYLRLVSKRLWDLGARPVEPPILKYRPPAAGDPNWLYSSGSWVPINAPDPDPRPAARRVLDAMLPAQKAEHLRELAKDLPPKQLREAYGAALLEQALIDQAVMDGET